MFKVKEAAGNTSVHVYCRGRLVSGASVRFIDWMRRSVPEHQLSAEQRALIRWYGKHYGDNVPAGYHPQRLDAGDVG